MNNFSSLNPNAHKTDKEQIVNSICSKSGLSRDIVDKLYESHKLNGMSDKQIVDFSEQLIKPKSIISSDEFIEAFTTFIGGTTIDASKRQQAIGGFLQLLDDKTNPVSKEYLDSVNLISVTKDILKSVNPKSTDVLSQIISTTNYTDEVITNLNESVNNKMLGNDVDNMVMLYEGLKIILAKNNRRWGNANRLQSAYQAICDYIDSEITEIQLKKSIVSSDASTNRDILNSFLSSRVDPIYKHFSSVRHMVTDSQTLVFDMVILVHAFVLDRRADLEFVKKQTFLDYMHVTKTLVALMSSSIKNSALLRPDVIAKLEGKKEEEYPEPGNQSLIDTLAYGVDITRINNIYSAYSGYDVRAAKEMIEFIKSASTEFNLKIRPVMGNYFTKAHELIMSAENARIRRSQYHGQIK